MTTPGLLVEHSGTDYFLSNWASQQEERNRYHLLLHGVPILLAPALETDTAHQLRSYLDTEDIRPPNELHPIYYMALTLDSIYWQEICLLKGSITTMIAQTAQPEQERTFHCFSRLPAELRWKIWEHNLTGPRLVSIRCGSDGLGSPSSSIPTLDDPRRIRLASASSSSSSSSSSSYYAGCTSTARIPVNLHVSHESRREALRHYQASFGMAHRPGQIFFSPRSDVLYFGARHGFMASEAQLRTVLTLCDPAELALVEKVAINDTVFWDVPAAAAVAAWNNNDNNNSSSSSSSSSSLVASSLLVDVLRLLRARMPGLRELSFVPRDENPLYSAEACLVEPVMAQSRLARVVREAMGVVFGEAPRRGLDERPWNWRIMALSASASASADAPVCDRHVLGWWDATTASGGEEEEEEEDVEYGNAHGPGYGGPGWRGDDRHCAGKGRELTRLSVLQESVRKEFMQMEMGANVVSVLVE